MPTGTVHDKGDPGQMTGKRRGKIRPDEGNGLLPFHNTDNLDVGTKVSYDHGYEGKEKIAINVKRLH